MGVHHITTHITTTHLTHKRVRIATVTAKPKQAPLTRRIHTRNLLRMIIRLTSPHRKDKHMTQAIIIILAILLITLVTAIIPLIPLIWKHLIQGVSALMDYLDRERE